MILYPDDLQGTPQRRLEDAGAKIVKPVFSFPGGRRFGARHRRADRTVIGLPDLDNCREYAIDETYRALRGDARPSLK